MPIYEYACAGCGHQLELMQSIKDPPLTQCPKCRKNKLRKLISAAGFQLKGSGWYVTDFRDKGKPAAEKKKEGEEGAAGTSPETKEAGSKPAAAGEPAKPAGKAEKKKKKAAGDGA